MATSKPRFSITLDADILDKVDKYQHSNRIQTRSLAIIELMYAGIASLNGTKSIDQRTKENGLSGKEDDRRKKLGKYFDNLNEEGKEKLLDYADDLAQSGKYIKRSELVVDKEA